MTGLSQLGSRNCAVGHTQAGLWHLRFGSKADIGETATDVRFTPESRHCRTPSSGPLCAKSGHSALRKKMSLFDNLVGAGEHNRRNLKAEGLGSLGVDHQLKFGRLLNWKIGRLRALENLVDIVSGAPKQVSNIGSVRHESAGCHKFSNSMK